MSKSECFLEEGHSRQQEQYVQRLGGRNLLGKKLVGLEQSDRGELIIREEMVRGCKESDPGSRRPW